MRPRISLCVCLIPRGGTDFTSFVFSAPSGSSAYLTQNEFDRLLSMLVLAQSDPNQRAALAQLTQQVLQLWQDGKFRDRIHVSTYVHAACESVYVYVCICMCVCDQFLR